jgi:hypothetical protein
MIRQIFLSMFLVAGCSDGVTEPIDPPPPPPPPPGTLRILMLGNSLTSTWDVPGIVADLAFGIGEPRPMISVKAPGNFGLQDHWNNQATRAMLTSGDFDWLVMQQGPSTLAESGANLTDYSARWADLARPLGVRSGLYVSWPPIGGNIDAGLNNHVAAAQTNDLALFPAGHAFRQALIIDEDSPIYGGDGFHPNRHGAWLAALTIAAVIYDRSPNDFPNIFPGVITPSEEAVLRAAAVHAVNNFGRQ